MEKNKLLDPFDHSEMTTTRSAARRKRFFLLFVVFFLVAVCLGCSLPRIIMIKDPLNPEEHLNLGVAYEKKGDLDLAIREYKSATKKLPVAYFYLGNAYFLKNEFEIAVDYYKKAIDKDSQNADAYNNLAWLYYMKRENLDEAEILALRALELNPQKAGIYQDTLDKILELKKR